MASCKMLHFIFLVVLSSVLFYPADALPREFSTKNGDCEVTNVNLVLQDGLLFVSWTAPSTTACPDAKDYRIAYSITKDEQIWYGPLLPIAPGMPMVQITIGDIYCERITVEINTINAGGSLIGITDEIPLEKGIPSPSNVLLENTGSTLRITWNPLWDSTETDCVVTYTLKYGDETENVVDGTSHEFTISDSLHCTSHTVEIVASSNEQISEPVVEIYTIGIPPVRILDSVSTTEGVLVNFDPPTEIPESCGTILYSVNERDDECFSVVFSIKAVGSEGFQGEESQTIIQKGPNPVRNLNADVKSDEIVVTWQPPYGGDKCNILYEIDYEDDIFTTHSTRVNIPYSPQSCIEKTIKLSGIIDDVKGRDSEVTVVGDIGSVEDLECSLDGEDVICNWEKPQNSDTCLSLQYLITYRDLTGLENTEITPELSFSILSAGCSLRWISVQPFQEVGDHSFVGDFIQTNVAGCAIKL